MPMQLFKLLLPLLLFKLLEAESPKCFRFTWIGPYENKTNIGRETCEARVGEFNDIPCEMPLVCTANDTVPDVQALWLNETLNRDKYLCQMSPGLSCVKYSYIFKGGIQNITYMCAKVNSSNGCYRQTHATGMQVEACVCSSSLNVIPCNNTPTTQSQQVVGLAIALLSVLIIAK